MVLKKYGPTGELTVLELILDIKKYKELFFIPVMDKDIIENISSSDSM